MSGYNEDCISLLQAVAPVMLKMFAEWSDLVATLNDIERRIEIIQIHQDLDEQNNPTIPRERPNRHYYQCADERAQPCSVYSDIQVQKSCVNFDTSICYL